MQLELLRFSSGAESTLGTLLADKKFACFTLEDEYRAVKVPGETRIPAGEYEIKLRTIGGMHFKYAARFSAFHQGMLWLQDVPDFEWIYIHCGVKDEDTAGCILVGNGVHENVTTRGYLSDSAAAYERFYKPVAAAIKSYERVTIQITDLA